MIRLVVTICDAAMAVNVGGNVMTTYKTFDIEHAELEKLLNQDDPKNSYRNTFVSGCEVFKDEVSQ